MFRNMVRKPIPQIIRVDKFEEAKEASNGLSYLCVTKTLNEGLGQRKDLEQQFRGTTLEVEFLPKIKLEIVVADEDVGGIVNAIVTNDRTGEIGDGKVFVLPVEGTVRVRTGDEGENAIQSSCGGECVGRELMMNGETPFN